MSVAAPTTRLQGCIYVPSAVTIRFTDDPAGVPSVSDFTIAAGTLYASHDDLIRAWQTELTSDLGGLAPTVLANASTFGRGYTTITTLGNNMSVDWSFSGTGTTIRDYLGFTGNIVNQASPQTGTNPTQAAFYPQRAAQVLTRRNSSRPRSQMVTLSGASRTQHSTIASEADTIELDVEIWFGTSSTHVTQGYFETVFLDGLDTYSSELQFTILHGTTSYFCTFLTDGELKLKTERIHRYWDQLWRLAFPVVTVGAHV